MAPGAMPPCWPHRAMPLPGSPCRAPWWTRTPTCPCLLPSPSSLIVSPLFLDREQLELPRAATVEKSPSPSNCRPSEPPRSESTPPSPSPRLPLPPHRRNRAGVARFVVFVLDSLAPAEPREIDSDDLSVHPVSAELTRVTGKPSPALALPRILSPSPSRRLAVVPPSVVAVPHTTVPGLGRPRGRHPLAQPRPGPGLGRPVGRPSQAPVRSGNRPGPTCGPAQTVKQFLFKLKIK